MTATGRPRPPYTPRAIQCASCGAPQQVRDERAEQYVCDSCGTRLKLSPTEVVVLRGGNNADLRFPLAIGDSFRWKGERYEVTSRMGFIEDGDLSELTRQYMLYNPRRGTLWLDEYRGAWSLGWDVHVMPRERVSRQAGRGTKVETWDGRHWVLEETGRYEVIYVDGALPWVLSRGDAIHYAEFSDKAGGREQYEINWTKGEVEYGAGIALTVDQVRSATGKRDLPGRNAIPTTAGSIHSTAMFVMAAALLAMLVNGALLAYALTEGSVVLEQAFSASDLTDEVMSRPFPVGQDGNVVRVDVRAGRLDNAWMALDLAVVKGDDTVVHATDADIEYYHGVEGGESWSEGSNNESVYVRIPEAGTYSLLLHAVSNSGETTTADRARHDVSVRVRDGAVNPGYALFSLAGSFVILVLAGVGYYKWRFGDDDDD